jgi:isopenicillin N synthase-like dioxygenase
MSAARNIPKIDLSDYLTGDADSRRHFIRTLGEGLVEFGFLNVEGHGIDPDLIRGTYELWQRFFDLPEAGKRKYAGAGDGSRGYTPFGVEHAKDNPLPDLKEFWHVGQEPPEGHPLRREYPGNVWPEEIPEIRQPTRRLYESLGGPSAEVPADHGRRAPGPAAAGDRAQEIALRARKCCQPLRHC